MTRLLACFALTLCLAFPAHAVQPDEVLDDPVLEERARDLSAEIRCLVCQNESIDESNAQLARDLRILVRERLVAGDSDQQVLDFLVARYGDYVLLRPPVKGTTALLWFGPLLVLLLAGGMIAVRTRGSRARPSAAPAALSAEEKARLEALLKADEERE
jgi:cytochrome c-type biogenesis protein CcmH